MTRPEWSGAINVAADHLVLGSPTTMNEAILAVAPHSDSMTVVFTVDATGSRPMQFYVDVFVSDQAFFYCELYDSGTPKVGLNYYDGTTFGDLGTQPVTGPFDGHTVTMTMSYAPGVLSCITDYPGTAMASGPVPDLGTPITYRLGTKNMATRISSFTVVRTN